MLKFPCLVLDHDDTVVQSEATVNFPYFAEVLASFRPGVHITLDEYVDGCYRMGFADMCRKRYGFTEQEIIDEYSGWQVYIRSHIPAAFPGIEAIVRKQKAAGGLICVVSHSCTQNITRDYSTHFGILPDEIYGWDLPEALRKPDPFPLKEIMRRNRLSPEELLVIDDMKPAYTMAHAAGVRIGFAAWGRKGYPALSAEMRSLCDYSFDAPQELEAFLFGGN